MSFIITCMNVLFSRNRCKYIRCIFDTGHKINGCINVSVSNLFIAVTLAKVYVFLPQQYQVVFCRLSASLSKSIKPVYWREVYSSCSSTT